MRLLSKAINGGRELLAKGTFSLVEGVANWYQRQGYRKLAEQWGAGGSAAGESVTRESAMRVATYLSCLRVLGDTEGMLPLFLYQQVGENSQKAYDHPLYSILHDAPNPEMSPMDFRGALTGHMCSTGDGFAKIARSVTNSDRIVGLWPLDPSCMQTRRSSSNLLEYVYTEGGREQVYSSRDIFHLRGFGFDGIRGYSTIELARLTFGTALAADRYLADFFQNDQTPGLVISPSQKLNPEETRNVKASWAEGKGPGNRHLPSVLPFGWKLDRVSINLKDLEFIESKKLMKEDICALMRVPPHMVAMLERSTNNNIEHQGMEFATYGIGPICTRWEQAISRCLLTPAERPKYYAKHNLGALMKADMKSRFEVYAIARQWGIYNVDKILEMEDQNRLPDGQGQTYLNPLNMQDARFPLNPPAKKGNESNAVH